MSLFLPFSGEYKIPSSLQQASMVPAVSNPFVKYAPRPPLYLYIRLIVYYLTVGERGMLELKRTTDYGKAVKTVGSKIYSFGLGGRFLFASVMTGKVSAEPQRNMIRLPAAKYRQFNPLFTPMCSYQQGIRTRFSLWPCPHCCNLILK